MGYIALMKGFIECDSCCESEDQQLIHFILYVYSILNSIYKIPNIFTIYCLLWICNLLTSEVLFITIRNVWALKVK